MSDKPPAPMLPNHPKRKSLWVHVKTGHLYYIRTLAWNESDLTPVVVYQRFDETPESFIDFYLDEIWVRPLSEFLDGRFIPKDN